jgi:hypothetical protein
VTFRYPQPLPERRFRNGGKSLAWQIQDALLDELVDLQKDDALPTSGRFLFYRLVAQAIVTKKQSGLVSDVLTELRNAKRVPMSWIVDRSRGVVDYSGYADLTEAARALIAGLQGDPWDGDVPLLMVESNSLAGVLEDLASEYRVHLCPLGGQSSTGLLGNELPSYLHDGQPVLYLGDLDLSGEQIEDSARERTEAYGGVVLEWERLALTEEQARTYDLPVIVKTDGRSGKSHEAIETEALDQRLLVSVVRERLDELLPRSLEDVRDEEQQECKRLLEQLA